MRPIIMSTDSVKAILSDRKTQTRRVIKPQPTFNGIDLNGKPYFIYKGEEYSLWALSKKCPYGQVGDGLWVREKFGYTPSTKYPVVYVGDEYSGFQPEWKPSIHMPRWASRITLEITEVRVERVQDITYGDCMKEGLDMSDVDYHPGWDVSKFKSLWDSLNAKRGYGWETNPWVWVISFVRG